MRDEGLRLALAPLGADLWPATEVKEALAFYLFYLPDLVLIDEALEPTQADEVYGHLESVGAAPLLVLASSRLDGWQERLPAAGLVLPGDGPDAVMFAAISSLTARHRSVFRTRPGAAKAALP